MKNAWNLDIDTYLEIIELAKKHGKKAGDSMQEEFDEIKKNFPEKFKHLGTTKYDCDLLTGNLREEGINILNLNEPKRGEHEK